MTSPSKPTPLQAAYADREKKARTLAKRTALLVQAWEAYQKAKAKERRLFNQQPKQSK